MGARTAPYIADHKAFNAVRPTLTVLVEAGGDKLFWQQYLGGDQCKLRDMGQGGRSKALQELDKVRQEQASGKKLHFLALLDADLDRLKGCLDPRPDVIWTDAHDLETTLLQLRQVVLKLLRGQVDSDKLNKAEKEVWKEPFDERLFRHAEGVGRLRWLNQEQGHGLKFKRMKDKTIEYIHFKFDKNDTWEPNLSNVIERVLKYSQRDNQAQCQRLLSSIPALAEACEALSFGSEARGSEEGGAEVRSQLCNGHDLMSFLRSGLGYLTEKEPDEETLVLLLRTAVEKCHLEQTAMWQALVRYQEQHPELKLFVGP